LAFDDRSRFDLVVEYDSKILSNIFSGPFTKGLGPGGLKMKLDVIV
jgi:hypothetical protein